VSDVFLIGRLEGMIEGGR